MKISIVLRALALAGTLAVGALGSASFAQTTSSTTASTTASSTAPIISSVMVAPMDTSATVTWSTDQPSSSQVGYGTQVPPFSATQPYANYTALDTSSTTAHSVTLMNLVPSTTYFYQVISTNDAGMSAFSSQTATFMTLASGGMGTSTGTTTGSTGTTTTGIGGTGTTTGTTTGSGVGTTTGTSTADIGATLAQLQAQLRALLEQISSILGGLTIGSGGSTGGMTGTGGGNGMTATIDQNGQSLMVGSSIDFGGRNFNHEEQVTVMVNGHTVATAHADGGGNFTTGSLPGPKTPGTYTYTFTGSSGDSATATITAT